MNKYFFQLKKERHKQAQKAEQNTGKQCPKCERWGFFCRCE